MHRRPESLPVRRKTAPSKAFFSLIGYNPYPFQWAIHSSWALYRVAIIGRQSGKSEVASAEAAFEVCCVPGTTGWIVAPTYEQASIIFERTYEKVKRAVQRCPWLKITQYSKRDLKLEVAHHDPLSGEYKGASRFAGKSGDKPDNLRGASLNYVIIDESAMINEDVWNAALKPTLSTTGGWVLMTTTPKGHNWVYEWYLRGQETTEPRYKSWQIPSWKANPTVHPSFYEEEKRILPDLVFRQEYGAEFMSEAASVFQGLDECPRYLPLLVQEEGAVTRVIGAHHNALHTYAIGADFAKLNDFSVFTVWDVTARQEVCIERMNTVAWSAQLARLQNLSREYGHAIVIPDITGLGDPLVEQIASMGIPVDPVRFSSLQVKETTVSRLALGIQYKRVTLIDWEPAIREMRNFVYSKTETGLLRMSAAGSGHDDIVISKALGASRIPIEALAPEAPKHNVRDVLDELLATSFEDVDRMLL